MKHQVAFDKLFCGNAHMAGQRAWVQGNPQCKDICANMSKAIDKSKISHQFICIDDVNWIVMLNVTLEGSICFFWTALWDPVHPLREQMGHLYQVTSELLHLPQYFPWHLPGTKMFIPFLSSSNLGSLFLQDLFWWACTDKWVLVGIISFYPFQQIKHYRIELKPLTSPEPIWTEEGYSVPQLSSVF